MPSDGYVQCRYYAAIFLHEMHVDYDFPGAGHPRAGPSTTFVHPPTNPSVTPSETLDSDLSASQVSKRARESSPLALPRQHCATVAGPRFVKNVPPPRPHKTFKGLSFGYAGFAGYAYGRSQKLI
jgi:hypothetical protein